MKKILFFLLLILSCSLYSQDTIFTKDNIKSHVIFDSILFLRSDNAIVSIKIDTSNSIITNVVVPAPVPPLILKFDDIANASTMIEGDASDVADWNTFFDLPTNGLVFTDVTVDNDSVYLYGGGSMKFMDYVFGDNDPNGTSLLEVIDSGNIVITCNEGVFYGLDSISKIHLPALITAGVYCFGQCKNLSDILLTSLDTIGITSFHTCESLTDIILPSLSTVGTLAFTACTGITSLALPVCTVLGETSGDNGVFALITGKTITITIPHALEADGDIVYLKANNTVTVQYSD